MSPVTLMARSKTSGRMSDVRDDSIATLLEIAVIIPGEEEWSLDKFKVRAQVVRIDPGVGVGCRFIEPAPELLAAIDKLIAARGVKD
jgi:hypothetical protein